MRKLLRKLMPHWPLMMGRSDVALIFYARSCFWELFQRLIGRHPLSVVSILFFKLRFLGLIPKCEYLGPNTSKVRYCSTSPTYSMSGSLPVRRTGMSSWTCTVRTYVRTYKCESGTYGYILSRGEWVSQFGRRSSQLNMWNNSVKCSLNSAKFDTCSKLKRSKFLSIF